MLERNTLIRNEVDFWLIRELTLAEKKNSWDKTDRSQGTIFTPPLLPAYIPACLA